MSSLQLADDHLCVGVEVDVSLLLDPGKGLSGWPLKEDIPEDNHDDDDEDGNMTRISVNITGKSGNILWISGNVTGILIKISGGGKITHCWFWSSLFFLFVQYSSTRFSWVSSFSKMTETANVIFTNLSVKVITVLLLQEDWSHSSRSHFCHDNCSEARSRGILSQGSGRPKKNV